MSTSHPPSVQQHANFCGLALLPVCILQLYSQVPPGLLEPLLLLGPNCNRRPTISYCAPIPAPLTPSRSIHSFWHFLQAMAFSDRFWVSSTLTGSGSANCGPRVKGDSPGRLHHHMFDQSPSRPGHCEDLALVVFVHQWLRRIVLPKLSFVTSLWCCSCLWSCAPYLQLLLILGAFSTCFAMLAFMGSSVMASSM